MSLQEWMDELDDSPTEEPTAEVSKPPWMNTLAPDAKPFDDESCPWCAAPAEGFTRNNMGQLACGNVGHVIPEDAEWYQNGEKVFFQ